MKKIYAYEWFGIQFKDFTSAKLFKVADSDFYTKFYCEFYKRFKSYSELPESYKKTKGEIARFLFEKTGDKSSILSIGCGNGYVEYCLAKLISETYKQGKTNLTKITAIEPSIAATQWINYDNVRLLHGFFPSVLTSNIKFDFAYSNVIDYVFNDKDYLEFLRSVVKYGINEFFLTDVIVPSSRPIFETIKGFIKDALSLVGLYESRQLWGYLRTIEEHKQFLFKAGFTNVEVGKFSHGTYWIKATYD